MERDPVAAGDAGESGGESPDEPDTGTGNLPCGGACPVGEACNEISNACEREALQCPCDVGSSCDRDSNTCVEGCRSDEDCAADQQCDTDSSACMIPPSCVAGLRLTGVSVNQAVEIPLLENGSAVAVKDRPAPIVQNRGALVRVRVAPDRGYEPGAVVAKLTLSNAGVDTVIEISKVVAEASDQSTLEGTMNLELEPGLIGPDTQLSVGLARGGCISTGGADRFPSTGSYELAAIKTGRIKVLIVPYERAPYKFNATPEMLEELRKGLHAYYPTEGFDLELHEPIPVMNARTDLSRILQHIGDLRAQENPAGDQYYFGLFTAAETFRSFCEDGCVAGISTLGGDSQFGDPSERYGVGIGYLSDVMTTSSGVPTTEKAITINTMAHELGHAHGRQHSPCGDPAGVDPRFPNDNADVETYGYSLATGQLSGPREHKDLMAYCEPQWIHPYTYSAFAKRVRGVNSAARRIPGKAVTYASVLMRRDGRASWGERVRSMFPPGGARGSARALDASGQVVRRDVAVWVTRMSDHEDTILRVAGPDAAWAALELDGVVIPIAAQDAP